MQDGSAVSGTVNLELDTCLNIQSASAYTPTSLDRCPAFWNLLENVHIGAV